MTQDTDPEEIDIEEAMKYLDMELREARSALWDGQSGRAFAAIEAAQDEFDKLEEAIDHD